MSNVMDKAHELGKEFLQDERFINFEKLRAKYEENKEIQAIAAEFNLKKLAYDNEMRDKAEETRQAAEKREQAQELYEKLMSFPVTGEYLNAKDDVEELLGSVYATINFYVAGQEPHSGCGGQCGGCSGCK